MIKPGIQYLENKFIEVAEREFSVNDNIFVHNYKTKEKWVPGIIAGRVGKYLYNIKVNETIIRRQ